MNKQRESIAAGKVIKRHAYLVDIMIRLVKGKPLGTIGGVIVIIMLFAAIFANLLAPFGMNEVQLMEAFQPPSDTHILGTDNLGRDMLSRIIFGAQVSMVVGLSGAALSTIIAMVIGIVSGFIGGSVDLVIQRIIDAWMSFPNLFLVLSIMALLGPGLLQVIIVLGVSGGMGSSRVIRSATISIKENVYVEAAKSIGCSTTSILKRHIIPNIMAPIIVVFTLGVGGMILAEASISFLGFGIPPPTPSWGGMLSGGGRDYMYKAPWLAIWPGLALSLAVFGINMLGDAVRDVVDPKLRGGVGRYQKAKDINKLKMLSRPKKKAIATMDTK
jgi:peptide/nickel transport system permease protein